MYRRQHLAHLNTHREGLRVPLLFADSHANIDRSPTVDIDTGRHGQMITTTHPYRDDHTIVRILLDGTPCWICDRWLAHRACEDCIDIWQHIGTEYYTAADALYLATTLTGGHYRGDTVILHQADELPENMLEAAR